MLDALVVWLDQVSTTAFWTCLALLVLVNGAAVYAFLQTRSRELVNRWTGRVLAANVLLIGTGVGVPAASYVIKIAAQAAAPFVSSSVTPAQTAGEDFSAAERTQELPRR